MRLLALLASMSCLAMAMNGCAVKKPPPNPSLFLALEERFNLIPAASIMSGQQDRSFSRHYPVTRNGKRLDCLILVAPTTIRASLGEISGSVVLECAAAPVFNIGDGLQMDVLLAIGGKERMVYGRYFDPGRRSEDRDWIPLAIAFEAPEANDAELRIRVAGGPQGDLVDDWLALSAVHLRRKEATQ